MAISYAIIWVFNHIDPWLSIVASIVSIYVIGYYINKQKNKKK